MSVRVTITVEASLTSLRGRAAPVRLRLHDREWTNRHQRIERTLRVYASVKKGKHMSGRCPENLPTALPSLSACAAPEEQCTGVLPTTLQRLRLHDRA